MRGRNCWGMISSAGVGPLFVFTVILMPVFIKHLFASMHFLIYTKGQLKVQYSCKTKSLATKLKLFSFLEEERIAVMKWPPQSPDMNPIDNICKIIEEKVQNRNHQNIDDLWGFLREERQNITTTVCKKLIGLCSQRFNEVI